MKASVWDGGSSDGTQAWVKAHCDRFNFPVELVELPLPFPLANDWSALDRSMADFIWYFSDDDLVLPECFSVIFSTLQAKPGAGAIAINYSEWSHDFSTCLNPSSITLTNAAIRASVDHIALLGQHAGFLPALLVSRPFAKNVPVDARFAKAAWPQVVPFLVTAATHGLTVIERPLIRQRSGNSAFGNITATSSWYRIFVQEWSDVCNECARLGLSPGFVRILRESPLREGNLGLNRILGERLHRYPPTRRPVFYSFFRIQLLPAILASRSSRVSSSD